MQVGSIWLKLALAGLGTAALLPLAVLWGVLSNDHQPAAQPEAVAALPRLAASMADVLVRGRNCAGDAGALLTTAATAAHSVIPITPADQPTHTPNALPAGLHAELRRCLDNNPGLAGLRLLDTSANVLINLGEVQAVGAADGPAADAVQRGWHKSIGQALALGRPLQTLAAGGSDDQALDQWMPVYGRALVLQLHYRLPDMLKALPPTPGVLQESLHFVTAPGTGVALPLVAGLRLAIDDLAPPGQAMGAQRWLVTASTLAMLLLGLGAVWWFRRAEQLGQATQDKQLALLCDMEDSASVGLRMIDNSGQIVRVNRAFCAASGFDRQQLLGTGPPYAFWPHDNHDVHAAHLDALRQGHVPPEGFVVPFVRPDGSTWTALVHARALDSGEGWIFDSRDISQELELQQRNERMMKQMAMQAVHHRAALRVVEFVHQMSNATGTCAFSCDAANQWAHHPARAALWATALSTAANADALRAEQGLLENVQQANQAALDLQGKVKAASTWITNPEALMTEPVALWDVVEDARAQQTTETTRRNVSVVNNVAHGLPPLNLDCQIMVRVLANLIENAMKAMDDTAIINREVTISSYVDLARRQVVVDVRDRGHGIPPHQRELVFEQGFHGRIDGHGFGLYFCRTEVERHGGTLTAGDNPPQGTAMVITLPLAAQECARG